MTNETNVSDLEQQLAAPAEDVVQKKKKSAVKADDVATEKAEASNPNAVTRISSGGGLSGKKVDITIHTGEGDIGKVPVKVGVNGYMYLIKRNERVTVPSEVVEILQNATQQFYSKGEGGREVSSNVPRFPMTVHG